MPVRAYRRWFHSRHHPVLILFVYRKGATSPTELLLDFIPIHEHRWSLHGVRDSANAGHQSYGRMAVAIRNRGHTHRSPTQTASLFRGKDGWFNVREEKIMVNRVLRDDPSKGDMHNRQAVTPKLLWRSFLDWEMWPIYLIGLSFLIPNHPITSYLKLQLRAIGFDTFETNLLSIPAYVLFIAGLLFWTWVSEKTNERFLTGLVSQIWILPLLVALETIPTSASTWTKYTLSILMVGTPYVHAINVAITSRNAGSVRTRTVASALYNMFVQASSLVAQNVSTRSHSRYACLLTLLIDLPRKR
jgi:hypothetical protein